MTGLSGVRRVLDWRFILAVAVLCLVGYVLVGSYQGNLEKDQRIAQLIGQGAKERAAAERRSAAAAKERDQLLEQSRRLERRLERLLAYLEDEGLQVPASTPPVSFPANKNTHAGVGARGPRTTPSEQNPTKGLPL